MKKQVQEAAMEYKEAVFNGKYMCKTQCRGVQRYTKEVLHALDDLEVAKNFKIIIPYKIHELDSFNNIKVVRFGGRFTSKFWQILGFQFYLITHKAFSINLSDGIPLTRIGIAAVHDVRYLDDLKKKTSLKVRLGLFVSKVEAARGIYHSKELVTVSEFSKAELLKRYDIPKDKVHVCYNAWQHLKKVPISEKVLEKDTRIKKGEYYFTLGGSEESKNMIWIMKMVQKYPDRIFVMAGPKNLWFPSAGVDLADFKNFIHLGYVTDEELKSLMKYSKAFLFPSKYEGFGIPPMEAISVGTKVIMSNAACLPEVYKNYVSYFAPDDYDVDLDRLLAKCPSDSEDLLKYYSWEKTAEQIVKLTEKYVEMNS